MKVYCPDLAIGRILLELLYRCFHFVPKYIDMKFSNWFRQLPVLLRVGIYLGGNYGLLFIAQIITGFQPWKNQLVTNGMFCALIMLFTALVLKWEKRSWKGIGCTTTSRRGWINFLSGTLGGILMLIAVAFTTKLLLGFHWELNPAFNWNQLLPIFITVFLSVFVQELAFRGYPFHILLEKWGEWPTQIIIAILFGCMHLSGNMSLTDILLTMLTTGIGSLLFGIAVIKTRQLHLAIGIHFGWNLLQFLLPRAASQNGEGIWIASGGTLNPSFGQVLLIWILPYMIVGITVFLLIKISVRNQTPEISS